MGKERKGEGKMTQLTSQLMPVAPCPVNSPVVTGSLSAEQQRKNVNVYVVQVHWRTVPHSFEPSLYM